MAERIFNPSQINKAAHVRASLGLIGAVYPSGNVFEERQLVGSASAALIVDYERAAPVSGTWHSSSLHYFDMTLNRRPKGALGGFIEDGGEQRSVGPILFAPAGHHYAGEGGCGRQKSLCVVVEARLVNDADIDIALSGGLSHCTNLEGESLRGLLARIEREVLSPGFASAVLLDSLCLSLIVETARALRLATSPALRKGGLSSRNLRIIEERVHLGDAAPSLSELATLCQLSPRHLVRAFHAETGRTIGDYVQQVSLDRAKEMLISSCAPIAEIARSIGFSNPAAFSTAFRRQCGLSPRSFRMRGRNISVGSQVSHRDPRGFGNGQGKH
ncbi:AraC family transcriptional regulator [Novosphingobium sp. ST904]|uniref:helix-turn-helix domain-containing protein n=1 Tax=Novosphingobium sp. ST904 TaxID=1684385 RepID=UPI001404A25A|nr:AraC family transcriptional regulator [Novosphingobium sp. ST904]